MSENIVKKEEVKKVEGSATVEVKAEKPNTAQTTTPNRKPANNKFRNNRKHNNRGPRNKRPSEFEERVVNIARVTNVVKGGRRFSFSTLVVIGNKKGRVAYGHGKAREVPDSIKKAIKDAKKNLINVPVIEGTVPHITQAKFVSSNVLLKPAPKGKGLIASGAVRAVVELAGYTDIVTKSLGSSNKTNVIKATLKALEQLKTVKEIANLRDKDESYFK